MTTTLNIDLSDFELPKGFSFKDPIILSICGQEFECRVVDYIQVQGGMFGNAYSGYRHTHGSTKIELRGYNLKKKQIEEARRKVNDTKEEHKKAQRELSKLLEDQ